MLVFDAGVVVVPKALPPPLVVAGIVEAFSLPALPNDQFPVPAPVVLPPEGLPKRLGVVEVAGVPKAGLPPREPPKILEDGAGVAAVLLPDCGCEADVLLKPKPLDGVALPKRGFAVFEVALVAKMLPPDADVVGVLLPNRLPDDGALLALANVRPLLGA